MSKQLLIGLLLAVSLHAFDELVLVISLPSITASLGGEQWYGLCIAAFMLASLVSVAGAGDWIDQHGPSGIFRYGMLSFLLGLVLASVAESMATLIVARVLQGFGGGIAWTVAYSVINRQCEPEEKSHMVAMLDTAWLVPALLAPIVGGFLVDYLDWRWVFLMQLPLVAVIYLLVLPRIQSLSFDNQPRDYSSVVNALKIGVFSFLIVYVISFPAGWLWLSLPFLAYGFWGPINRVFPKGWLTLSNPLAVAVVLHLLTFFAFFGMETFLPLFLIEERGFTTTQAGFLFTFGALTWVLASFVQSYLDQKISHQHSMLMGVFLLLVVLAIIITVLNPAVPASLLYVAWLLAGFAMGLLFNAAATAAMLATEDGREGATASATGMAETLGIALASGVGGGIKNQVEFSGGDLSSALLLIWLLIGGVLVFSAWVLWRKFPASLNWHKTP